MTALAIVLAAIAALFAYNVGMAVLVIAENRGHGWIAGWLSAVTWCVNITGITIAVTALQGHSFWLKTAVILAALVANFFGAKLGQVAGQRYVHDDTIESRLAALEAAESTAKGGGKTASSSPAFDPPVAATQHYHTPASKD